MPFETTCPLAEKKRRIRKIVRDKRLALPPRTRNEKSEAICESVAQLFGIESDDPTESPRMRTSGEAEHAHSGPRNPKISATVFGSNESMPDARLIPGSTIALYAAFEDEVDLSLLARRCYEAELHVAFPCMNPRSERYPMCMRQVDMRSWTGASAPFLANPLLRLPLDDAALERFPIVAPETIDAIVVPLVAFDETRRRLGYGGGNYDSFLPLVSPRCLVVGVAFCEQRVARVPVEPHDLALPCIVCA